MKTITQETKQKNRMILWLFLSLTVVSLGSLTAQVQNNGSLYIGDGGSVFVKTGAFTFGASSTTVTSRTATTFGKLIFANSVTESGAATGGTLFTNGYASTLSTAFFLLPVGQSTVYAPVGVLNAAAPSAGVHAAYFRTNPATADSDADTTADATLDPSIQTLSTDEYWDIEGDNATITLNWTSTSNVGTITNSIANLTVAGYDAVQNKWVAIPSGTPTGNLVVGSIATSSAVTLATYSAFTLAERGIECAPVFAGTGSPVTFDGTNWSTTPSDNDFVTITGAGAPGSFVCNTLTVNANITLTDGQTIEVVNGISGTGVITMSSEASILQRNNSSAIEPHISLTKKSRSGMYVFDYIYWGSPLATTALTVLDGAQVPTFATGAFDSKYKYVSGDLTTSGGWQPLNAIERGKGFIMRIKQQAPFTTVGTPVTEQIALTFTGETNNGEVNVNIANTDLTATPLSARNNNLLANPYPSAIDADKFLEYNTNVDGVVYLWKAQTPNPGTVTAYIPGDYIAYTRAGSAAYGSVTNETFDGKIATGQGFKVKALLPGSGTPTSTVTFNNCMRVSGNNAGFLKTTALATTTPSTLDRYKLNMSGANGAGSQILVAYLPETTLAYDRMYDAETLSVSGTQLYSILDNATKKLAINARPSFETTDVVQLGVSKTGTASENFSIAIAEKEGVFATDAVTVFLHDTVLNVYHNLANGAYTFNSNSVELNNRFQVVYQDGTLSNIDFESNNVIATISNQNLQIAASLPITEVAIYDIAGRLVTAFTVANEVAVTKEFRFAEGVYIAKIKMNTGAIATQKLINKK